MKKKSSFKNKVVTDLVGTWLPFAFIVALYSIQNLNANWFDGKKSLMDALLILIQCKKYIKTGLKKQVLTYLNSIVL